MITQIRPDPAQTNLSDFEPMIVGKTHSEIILMDEWAKRRWYGALLRAGKQEEHEEAKRIVKDARIAKIKAWWTPKRKHSHSAAVSGEKSGMWKGGISSLPYCYLFNGKLKEHIRNLYNRICTVCGKSTLQNINKNGKWLGRLAVDHLDENKMQGCDDWEWRLTPLCVSCHGQMLNQQIPRHLLLQLLLLNNKSHQTNFLFEDEMQSNRPMGKIAP